MRSPDGGPARASRPGLLLRYAELALLVGAAVYALLFWARLPARLPSEADHRAAGAYLAQHAQPGDALLLFPWWTERARLFAPEGLDVVGYLGSDRDDLERHPRVWVLSQPELPRADASAFERAFLPGRRALDEPRRFGPLALRLYENGRHRPRAFSATEALARASVWLERPDGRRERCAFDGRAHRCPNAPVTAGWYELLYQPRRCVLVHAPGGASRVVLELPGVPRGALLRLTAGIIWEYAWQTRPGLTVTRVEVSEADGAPLVSLALPPGLEGAQRAELAAPEGPPRAVRVAVQSDNPDTREVCVELEALGPPAREVAREG